MSPTCPASSMARPERPRRRRRSRPESAATRPTQVSAIVAFSKSEPQELEESVFTRLKRSVLLLLLAVAVPASAAYPDRPIKIICPMPAGSAADALTRLIGHRLSETLGQQVIVENKAGADGAIAALLVAKAPPDGYTLFLGTNSPLSAVPVLRKSPPYEVRSDFAPIGLIGKYTMFLTVHPSVAVNTVGELVELARTEPGKLTIGAGSTGGLINAG